MGLKCLWPEFRTEVHVMFFQRDCVRTLALRLSKGGAVATVERVKRGRPRQEFVCILGKTLNQGNGRRGKGGVKPTIRIVSVLNLLLLAGLSEVIGRQAAPELAIKT